jgi:hypothetical protein
MLFTLKNPTFRGAHELVVDTCAAKLRLAALPARASR